MIKKSLFALLSIAVLAIGWSFVQGKRNTTDNFSTTGVSPTDNSTPDISTTGTAFTENPPQPDQDAATLIVDSVNNSSTASATNSSDEGDEPVVDLTPVNDIEASSVAVEPLSDAEFTRLENLLKNDKQLRLSLLEEFRYNTDPVRAKQLAALLGPYDDAEILEVASELAYSGETQSRLAGLNLLRRIQPGNDQARDIAIDLLTTGGNTKILVATMNVFAKPSPDASERQLQTLNDNLNNLSRHHDSNVRSHSISLLSRWDKNSSVARDAFSRGLSDTDPAVRSSAVFAVNNISDPDETMISDLLNIAENTDEKRSTRYAAIRALNNMPLSGTQTRRYSLAQRSANSRN